MAIWLALLTILAIVAWAAIDDLKRRVSAIEAAARERAGVRPVAPPAVSVSVPAPAPAPPTTQPPTQEPVPKPAPVLPVLPVPTERQPVVATAPVERRAPAAAAVTAAPTDGWELEVGTSWLSKIGALVVVIGVALFARYAIARVTPIGRVAIGYAATIGMLALGVALERRDRYRNYAYALIAGGWAGVYFMTYAMHAVDSTRVIDDEFVAASCLAVVATGMIAHSLWYRSQTVTTLAYVVAYATLALTPLSGFSLVASIPLSASVVVVAQRFNWSRVSMAGLASTYGLFAIRGVIFAGGTTDAQGIAPYLTLAAYWLTFDTADILALRRARESASAPAPLFALNLVGLVGAAALELPMDDPIRLSWFLAAAGSGYLTSAVVRARWLGRQSGVPGGTAAVTFGTIQAAVAVAASCFAWAVVLRFSGRREVLVLLLEAEMLVASGFALGDRVHPGDWVGLRRAGHRVRASARVGQRHDIDLATAARPHMDAGARRGRRGVVREPRMAARQARHSPRHRIWLHVGRVRTGRDRVRPRAELAPHRVGECALQRRPRRSGAEAWTRVPLPGLRGRARCRGVDLSNFLVASASSTVRDAWVVLPAGAASAYLVAVRLGRRASSAPDADLSIAAGAMACLGTAFLALLEWRLLEEPHALLVGPAWASTAVVCLAVGIWRRVAVLRWHGYLLLFAAATSALEPIVQTSSAPTDAIAWMSLVIGALYGASLVSRHAIGLVGGTGGPGAQLEETCRLAVSMAATFCLTVLIANEVRSSLVTLAWGAEGIGLLALGLPLRERVMRLSGLAVLFLCTLKLFMYDLSELEAMARILSFVGLGVVLLGVSWAYTRYQEQIKRLL